MWNKNLRKRRKKITILSGGVGEGEEEIGNETIDEEKIG